MKVKQSIYKITVAALLCAVGILIPAISPLKFVLEPASFTLASHVAIFIAMFISPVTAAMVAVGTTLGFLIGGFPLVIVARAASHLIFAIIGAVVLNKKQHLLDSIWSVAVFSILISLIHGLCEVFAVMPFYFNDKMTAAYYESGFFITVVLLVGAGTVVHSMVDFIIALTIWKPIKNAMR